LFFFVSEFVCNSTGSSKYCCNIIYYVSAILKKGEPALVYHLAHFVPYPTKT